MYNLIDKPICLQDANQQGRQEWAYVKYDALGRVVTTGIQRSNTSTRAALQAAVTNGLTNSTYTEWEQPGTAVQGYSNTAYPISNEVPLTVNYYDGYTFTGKPSTFATPSGASAMTKGLLTATKTTVLNTMYNATPDMLWMVSFYDDLGRVTQSYSQHYLGGTLSIYNYDKVNSSYDFTNEVTATTRQHYIRNSTNSASVLNATIANGYSYDHMGRKMQTTETVNSGTRVILAQNSYNELGQLINKGLHSTDDVAFYQNIYYTYNERGWLMASTGDLFTEKLQYNANPLNVSGFTAQYNGNIASQTRTAGATPTTTSYAYTYDYLDRLTKAVSTDSYNESGIVYDLNGNITALQRTAGSSTPIDNLAYTYTNSAGTYTNQVQSITDAAADVSGNGYPQGAFAYGYDANGNISTDASKALNITAYNQLNLPQSVTLNGATITYTYDANGRKLRKTSTVGTGTTTDYIDGIEYDNGTLSFAQTEEGRVILAGGITNYEYNLSDNLGNVRLSFDTHLSTPTQTQQDDYYAFGYEISRGSTTSPKNEYLYNKKELQEEFTEYDYGARFYDPIIGRWTTVDPKAELDRRWSVYVYGFDNGIRFEDPDGMEACNPCDVPDGGCGNCNMPRSVGVHTVSTETFDTPAPIITAKTAGEILSVAGTITTGAAYVAAIVPGTEELAPGLFAGGKALSFAGATTTAADQFSQGKTSDGVVTLVIAGATLGSGQIIDDAEKAGQVTKGAALAYNFATDVNGDIADAIHGYAMKKTETQNTNLPKVAPKQKVDPKQDKIVKNFFKPKKKEMQSANGAPKTN